MVYDYKNPYNIESLQKEFDEGCIIAPVFTDSGKVYDFCVEHNLEAVFSDNMIGLLMAYEKVGTFIITKAANRLTSFYNQLVSTQGLKEM